MRVEPVAKLGGYFHERLRSALDRRHQRLDGPLQIYLIDLLERYAAIRPERVLHPLALHLADALEAPTPQDRLRRFREMGDAALCVCGLFHEHLAARGISRRYVVSMGGQAYRHAGHLASAPGARSEASSRLFGQLAERFGDLASLIDDVRETTDLRTPQDVVRTYDRWRRTRSPVLADRLRRAGVFPQDPRSDLVH